MEMNIGTSSPELHYDHEIIFSRDSQVGPGMSGRESSSFPVFYDHLKKTFYLSISDQDREYYNLIKNAPKESIITSRIGPEFFEYSNVRLENVKRLVTDLNGIGGVKGDAFSLCRGRKEYWRFLFPREKLADVSDFVLDAMDERSRMGQPFSLGIEYLGRPHSLSWYLREYGYARKVVSVEILEVLSDEYLGNAPHYNSPFHFDLKTPDFGDGTVRYIRFSGKTCESGGYITDQLLIRDGKEVVTEDVRKGPVVSGYFDFKNSVFVPTLWYSCDYDGRESVGTYILDRIYLDRLLRRIKEINDSSRGLVNLVVSGVETFYEP
ncbi:MAG: hypothetical protein M0Z77_05480 [Thermoplasmatales archaeon]|jgi:hypothetical protein|nr:hypothetical protein [Thermoplasmatales archaeon]